MDHDKVSISNDYANLPTKLAPLETCFNKMLADHTLLLKCLGELENLLQSSTSYSNQIIGLSQLVREVCLLKGFLTHNLGYRITHLDERMKENGGVSFHHGLFRNLKNESWKSIINVSNQFKAIQFPKEGDINAESLETYLERERLVLTPLNLEDINNKTINDFLPANYQLSDIKQFLAQCFLFYEAEAKKTAKVLAALLATHASQQYPKDYPSFAEEVRLWQAIAPFLDDEGRKSYVQWAQGVTQRDELKRLDDLHDKKEEAKTILGVGMLLLGIFIIASSIALAFVSGGVLPMLLLAIGVITMCVTAGVGSYSGAGKRPSLLLEETCGYQEAPTHSSSLQAVVARTGGSVKPASGISSEEAVVEPIAAASVVSPISIVSSTAVPVAPGVAYNI